MTTATPNIGDRTSGIGGSDIACLLGANPHRGPVDLWLEKTGRVPPFEGNFRTRFGNHSEALLREEYHTLTGRVARVDETEYRHPDHPWAMGHIDFRVDDDLIGEIKCSSIDGWGKQQDSDEPLDAIPDHFMAQVQFYLGLTGAKQCDVVACLWGGYGPDDPRIYTVDRLDSFIGLMLEEGARFWHDHVLADVEPEPRNLDEAKKLWRHTTSGKVVDLAPDAVQALAELERAKAQIKRWDTAKKDAEFVIKTALRDAEAGAFDGEELVRLPERQRRGYTVEPTSYRTLTLTKTGKAFAERINQETQQ